MILSLSPVFCTAQVSYNSNDHGQGDCQCIGKGIQVYPTDIGEIPPQDALNNNRPSPSANSEEGKTKMSGADLWRIYLEFYIVELRNSIHIKKGN